MIRWIQTAATLGLIGVVLPLTLQTCDVRRIDAARRTRAAQKLALGQRAMEAKDPMLAAQAFTYGIELDPDSEALRDGLRAARVQQILDDAGVINTGNALSYQADLAAAVASESPKVDELLAYARIEQFRGQAASARARLRQATQIDGKSALARLLYGDALLKAGKLDAASVELDLALELDKSLVLARFALAQVRIGQGRHKDALPLLEEAVKTLKIGPVYFALGQTYSELEQWGKAEKALERALALRPGLVKAHRMLADAYLKGNRIEAAMGAYALAYEKAGDVDAYYRVGRIYAQARQHEQAAEVFGQLRALDPTRYEPHCQIGAAADGLRQVEVAIEAYGQCVKLAKGSKDGAKIAEQAQKRLAEIQNATAKTPAAKKKRPR